MVLKLDVAKLVSRAAWDAAEAIISDHGGRNLREVKRMAKTRRVAIR